MQATPIYELSQKYADNRVFIKRDDLVPFSFGGNKARKARLFYQDIIQKNIDVIVTYGSSKSNHCRIISNMAAAMGLECHIISSQENYEECANSKMISSFGAQIETCPVHEVSRVIDETLDALKKEGKHPYFIMGGGHGNFGTAAYVTAYQEILRYEKEEHRIFDYIFFASGTGTTQAGLVCGKLIEQMDPLNKEYCRGKIIGISISREKGKGYDIVKNSIKDYLKEQTLSVEEVISDELIFIDDYRRGGYGIHDQHVSDLIDQVMCQEGIPMDKTYVGKAFCGMQDYLNEHAIKDSNVLFIHTGGTPLYFD
ncbi:MAG: pyridoxal-phosphate dependent enzyme [Clostridia bacterium]|nr:pyridoxal-phosphate dependent enzyme [Clostridia bacterium]